MELKNKGDHALERLPQLVGEVVSVWIGESIRKSFSPAISVSGVLEKHSENEQYRVLVSDGTYTYFEPRNIAAIAEYSDGSIYGDGSIAVIQLKLEV